MDPEGARLRYRLRFHLQEVDLIGDEVIVGRGSMGQVTIDDPMLSRRHIRIDLSGSQPALEDLNSRNGTQLNGRPLIGRAALQDGDRIRLGTQELVFLVPNAVKKNHRTTCGLTFCVGCAVPYPSASPQCPHCGAIPTEHGLSTSARDVAASGWTFHLLCQVVDRAIDQGRLADAERMMSRGVTELEEQLEEGVEVEPDRIVGVAECAARLGCALRSCRWLDIGARLYGRAGEPPSRKVLALVDDLPVDARLANAMGALRHAGPKTRQAG
jgi:hypothetical protein